MAKTYTTAQAAVIQEGWYVLQRMIESNSKMERRLSLCEKEQRKHFPVVAARSFVMHSVLRGMRLCNEAEAAEVHELSMRAGDDDEHVLAMAIGMHYANHEKAREVMTALAAVKRAETEAQEAFLKTI